MFQISIIALKRGNLRQRSASMGKYPLFGLQSYWSCRFLSDSHVAFEAIFGDRKLSLRSNLYPRTERSLCGDIRCFNHGGDEGLLILVNDPVQWLRGGKRHAVRGTSVVALSARFFSKSSSADLAFAIQRPSGLSVHIPV